MIRRLTCCIALLLTPAAALAGDDRPITARERAGVLAALRSQGCVRPARIEREDHGFEADDVRCRGRDGLWEFELAHDFRILDRSPEDHALSARERNGVFGALTRARCRVPASIERDDDGFEVEDARCRDGVRDLRLDGRFHLQPEG